jgi:hypothetical protein
MNKIPTLQHNEAKGSLGINNCKISNILNKHKINAIRPKTKPTTTSKIIHVNLKKNPIHQRNKTKEAKWEKK